VEPNDESQRRTWSPGRWRRVGASAANRRTRSRFPSLGSERKSGRKTGIDALAVVSHAVAPTPDGVDNAPLSLQRWAA
jgi:hypothetical protein